MRQGAQQWCRCQVRYADGHGTVEWEVDGKDRAMLSTAVQIGRILERGHSVQEATVTTARGRTYDVASQVVVLLEVKDTP